MRISGGSALRELRSFGVLSMVLLRSAHAQIPLVSLPLSGSALFSLRSSALSRVSLPPVSLSAQAL